MGEQSPPIEVARVSPRPKEPPTARRAIAMSDVPCQVGQRSVLNQVLVLVPELHVTQEASEPACGTRRDVLDRKNAAIASQSCSRST
jgi:hypothetical protein